jgi:hypothetical protein
MTLFRAALWAEALKARRSFVAGLASTFAWWRGADQTR